VVHSGSIEERFLPARADAFAGANAKKKRRLAPLGMTVHRWWLQKWWAVIESEAMSATTQVGGRDAGEARGVGGANGGAVGGTGISRRWLRIVPVALVMYTIAFIDRTNISLALPRISRDLGLDPAQAGNVAGIFYWGYLALQIPGGHLAKYWSPKKFISVLLVFWAVCAVGCCWEWPRAVCFRRR
jgi:Major Facilitator Superfamily